MMVVMTMWLPRFACSQAGINAQAAPKAKAATVAEQPVQPPRQRRIEGEADERHAEAADIGLPLAADVEQAGMEGDRDRQAGEDEVGGVEQREADALAIAERAVEHEPHGLERVLADDQDDAGRRRGTRRPG